MENQSLYVLFSNYLSDEKYDHPANRKSIFAISQNADIWYLPGLQTPVQQQSGKPVLKSWHRPILISF